MKLLFDNTLVQTALTIKAPIVTNSESLASRVSQVQQQISDACARAARDPAEVTLLPVSKTFGAQSIREMMALGFRRFGENRLQEIAQKAPELADCDIEWVVIGHVQTNKAKEVAKYASELQSLDRLSLAQALDKRLAALNRTLKVLVQVKTSPEDTKSGLEPGDLIPFLKEISRFPTLKVEGLMTMAILSDDENAVRQCFRQLRLCRDQARDAGIDGVSLNRLSMGMSGDMALAIEEGSTEVRVGTAIFGKR